MAKGNNKRSIAAAMLLVLALGLLAGCTAGADVNLGAGVNAGDEPVTLRISWWGNQVRNELTAQVLELYAQSNPHVQFEMEFYDWDGYWDKLSAPAATGSLPDILQMDVAYLQQYQQKGLLADLQPFVADGTLNLVDVDPATVDMGRMDGGLYALCAGINCKALLVDTAVLRQAGVTLSQQPTWDEFFAVAETVYAATGKQIFIPSEDVQHLLMLAHAAGESLFNPQGAALGLSSDKVARQYFDSIALTMANGTHVEPGLLAQASTNQLTMYASGLIWCDLIHSNQVVNTIALAGEGAEFAIYLYPQDADAVRQTVTIKPSMFFSVAETSQHKAEAAKVLDFFTNSVEAGRISLTERGVPISSTVMHAIREDLDEVEQAVLDYVEGAMQVAENVTELLPNGYSAVSALVKELSDSVRYGVLDAQTATESFMQQADEILAQSG